MSKTISIIGFGNLGSHLYEMCTRNAGFTNVQVIAPAASPAKPGEPPLLSWGEAPETEVYFLAVPDEKIPETAEKIPQTQALVIHSSGALPLKAIPQPRRAVLYPLESFTKGMETDYKRIPFFLEASDDQSLAFLEALTTRIGKTGQYLRSEARLKLHLAAVLSNNFVNHLLYLSQCLLAEIDVDLHQLRPLLDSTLRKAFFQGPKASQTGPAVRGDRQTIEKHLALAEHKKLQSLYEAVTESIIETHESTL